ncbi:MAG: ATP-binding protein [Rhodobacteraceae bacterium]|nr:ATP-binding protein [Paracoccaceae bacterium]
MSNTSATLHMLCGKIAAGKSTLASRLGRAHGTVLLAEDDWLNTLFSDQMRSGADYLRCAAKLHAIMAPHIMSLLKAGVSVVLDFPANTLAQRDWMRGIIAESGAAHQLHVLHASDELCLKRLRARNAKGDHPFAVSDAQFHQFSKHFVAPSPDEGFTVVVHNG